MMARLEERAAQAGEARADMVRDELAAVLRAVPGVTVAVADEDVVVTGRGVVSRGELRWVAGLMR